MAPLHRCGRRNDASLVEQIVTALRTPALRQPPPVEAALGQTVVDELEQAWQSSLTHTLPTAFCDQRPALDRCSPRGFWARSATPPASPPRVVCARSPAPRRSLEPLAVPAGFWPTGPATNVLGRLPLNLCQPG
ncbi:hypothetical protein FRAHR75_680038 [Frankia sp. Hr75.2]|nr:hypothetical protein FRAHR75_680038 [Frankia sp. Hr75.2]